jgi:hypothetical protein
MVRLLRHCRTKEAETDRLTLNYYANSLPFSHYRFSMTPKDLKWIHVARDVLKCHVENFEG